MPAPHHSVFYRPDALPAAQSVKAVKAKIKEKFLVNCIRFLAGCMRFLFLNKQCYKAQLYFYHC